MMPTREKIVLFLGSGFSADFGLPVTSKIQDQLLGTTGSDPGELECEEFISETIAEFWKEVFGWAVGRRFPALEDHFTQIDLAANSGHYLGNNYGPKKLRALRRMTIHRVFRLLDVTPIPAVHIESLIGHLTEAFQVSVVTTNWDIMVERCLEKQGRPHVYSGQLNSSAIATPLITGIPVCKLHGSANWGYCDMCRTLITSDLPMGKTALRYSWLLECDDFKLFSGGDAIADSLPTGLRTCRLCGGNVAVRVATFSYRKHLEPTFFYSIWDAARDSLRSADRWLFVGYSLPEADIEIRHLLKTTQLARSNPARPQIDVVLKSDRAAMLRYKRMFGRSINKISNKGIEQWVREELSGYRL